MGLRRRSNDLDRERLLAVLTRVQNGDFGARMPVDSTGVNSEIASTLNQVIAANASFERELSSVSRSVGTEGRLSERLAAPRSTAAWDRSAGGGKGLVGEPG